MASLVAKTSTGERHQLAPAPPPLFMLQLFILTTGTLAMLWSTVALGTFILQGTVLSDLVSTPFVMGPWSAVGFLLAGASLLLHAYGIPSTWRRRAAHLTSGLLTVWGIGCVVSKPTFSSIIGENGSLAIQPLPSIPIVCILLACLGLALFTLSLQTSTGRWISQSLAVMTTLMGGSAVLGYLYRVPPLYESGIYGPIDPSTAMLSFVMGVALLCIQPTQGLMRTLMSPDIGGTLLRRLLPFAIGLPILGGYLRILGQRQGWYSFDFGVAVAIGVVLTILLACLWYVAGWADRVDRERHSMSLACRDQETRLNLAAAAARIGYWRWMDPDTIEIDAVSSQLLGVPSNSTLSMRSLERAISPEDRTAFRQAIDSGRHDGKPFEIECRPVMPTQAKWISLRGLPSAPPHQSLDRFHGVVLDVTERRTVQEALQESQERLNSIVQSAMDAIITVDHDQHIVLFNQAAEQLFRCRAEEAIGKPIVQFIPERFRQRHQSHIMTFQESSVTARPMGLPGFVRALRADGHEFPIEASISQVNVGGQSLCTVILRDITKRVQSEEAIREREARFRTMADSAPVMMFVTDSKGSCTYLNRQWYDFTGQTEETGLRTGWLNQVHEDDRSRLVESLRIPSGPVVRRLECRVLGYRGSYQWTLCSILTMVEESGAVSGSIGSIVDITDRKMAEQTLKRWADELESQVSERTAALSRSQERLRALTIQLTRTEHQERRRIAGELHDYLAQLLVAAHLKLAQDSRLLVTEQDRRLVRDLERILDEALTYTRSLVAKLSPPVLYHLGLPAALQWLAEQMEEHQLIVETVIDIPSTLPKLPDDVAAILFQSVRELLFNVVKHAGSSTAQIAMRTDSDRSLMIVVSDQGQGFDVARSEQPSTAPTSFGLFSVKERIEALGGSMHVSSRVGHGTSVTLRCPLATQQGSGSRVSMPASHDAIPTQPERGSATSLRILLADDHAMVREGIRALLERQPDLEVVGEAWDGQHACDLTDALRPDVIVMDANMPRLDGIEATRRIRQRYPRTVIIGLSVQTAAQVATSMLQAGASHYLTKESAGEQLYETILAAVAQRDGKPQG